MLARGNVEAVVRHRQLNLAFNRPELDIGYALPSRLTARYGDEFRDEVETEHVPAQTGCTRDIKRRGPRPTGKIEDTMAWLHTGAPYKRPGERRRGWIEAAPIFGRVCPERSLFGANSGGISFRTRPVHAEYTRLPGSCE
jgi:hypothetical protein